LSRLMVLKSEPTELLTAVISMVYSKR